MKKKLTLKLIESNDVPKIGCIYIDVNGNLKLVKTKEDLPIHFHKSYEPVGISDEEPKEGDQVLYLNRFVEDYEQAVRDASGYKIELLPEHFSNDILQLIVDGVLVDGSEIEVEYRDYAPETYPENPSIWVKELPVLDSNGKAIISIPESDFYSLDSLLNRVDKLQQGNTSTDKPVYTEEEVEELIMRLMHQVCDGRNDIVFRSADFKLSPKQWFEQNKKK